MTAAEEPFMFLRSAPVITDSARVRGKRPHTEIRREDR